MEFLLINHPLDCPICDQGGECELQDLSLGYGRGISRFTERKRSVADENIGPLIATYMTRCIHCTRCVRVLGEIAGTHEFGGMNRGEHLEIGTYIGKSVESELGGNIIDVCPVGALTDKVFQFKARAWELIARKSIGYHDALGSNLWLHTRHGQILRAVPRDNDDINECWLSDRDRYSHQGLYADDRATSPMVKRDDTWQEVDWQTALEVASKGLGNVAGTDLGFLVHPASSCEEGLLLKRLANALECHNIDHRLRQLTVDTGAAPAFEMPVANVQHSGATLLVGSYPRHEMPLFNHRLRQSVLKGGKVFVVNPLAQDFNYPLAGSFIAPPQALLDELLVLACAASDLAGKPTIDASLAEALRGVQASDAARSAVAALRDAEHSLVVVGHLAAMHPQADWLRAATRLIADATGSALNELPLGANALGMSRVGVLPDSGGLDARQMQLEPRKAYVLFGAEPPHDFADGSLISEALDKADFVVALSAYAGKELRQFADVILPIAALPEMEATLTNLDGFDQRTAAAGKPPGQARPGWRVLRALADVLAVPGFEFTDLAGLRAGMATKHVQVSKGQAPATTGSGLEIVVSQAIYRVDGVIRRSQALQAHPLNVGALAVLNPADAANPGISDGAMAKFTTDVGNAALQVVLDVRVAPGCIWIESGYGATAPLAASAKAEVGRA